MTEWKPGITSEEIIAANALWNPVMAAEEAGELTEAQAAAQLGLTVPEYQAQKAIAEAAIADLVITPPTQYPSYVDALRERPELLKQ